MNVSCFCIFVYDKPKLLKSNTHNAAPMTDNATAKPTPNVAQIKGDVPSRNLIRNENNDFYRFPTIL